MSYEFTKQKISASRYALMRRLAIAGLGACTGLAIGVATNDMHDIFGIFLASVVATAAGFSAFYLTS